MTTAVHGRVAPGFERVRDTFADNFARHREVGAAVSVWHEGEHVVDLWGGVADPHTGAAWHADTPVVVFSSTKGMAATALLMLIDRGALDPDAPVTAYWPGFGAGDKGGITVRQLLSHRAGLCAVERRLTLDDFADLDVILPALEQQRPLWEPGTDQGYGATAFGMYAGELFRRIAGRTLGGFFADEVAGPLGADVWIGLPDDVQDRVAPILPAGRDDVLRNILPSALARRTAEGRVFRRVLLTRRTAARLAFANPDMGPARLGAMNEPRYRSLELPWMGGVASARGLARVYVPLSLDGAADGVRLVSEDTLQAAQRVDSWVARDRVLQKPMGFTLGYTKDEPHLISPHATSFGHTGAGGSVGFADPREHLAVGYVMNRMDWRIRSPRCLALTRAIYDSIGVSMPAG